MNKCHLCHHHRTIVHAHTCTANVLFNTKWIKHATKPSSSFCLPSHLLQANFCILDIDLCTRSFAHNSPELRKQEIIAAIQFINCKWKLNMQRNFFFLFSLFDLICFSGCRGEKCMCMYTCAVIEPLRDKMYEKSHLVSRKEKRQLN